MTLRQLNQTQGVAPNQRRADWLTIALRQGADARRAIQPAVEVRIVLRTREGEQLWVGRVIAASKTRFAFAPWGQRDSRTLLIADVLRAGVVPPHTWAERHAVVERQRRGLPAR